MLPTDDARTSKPGAANAGLAEVAGSMAPRTVVSEAWDLSQERAFIENLLCQRFNFLLVFYSLVVAGAFTTGSQRNFNIVLTVGAIISSLFALPIARAQHKLDLILRHLAILEPTHPARMTDLWASDLSLVPVVLRPIVRLGRRDVIGYWIPLLCTTSLWVGAVLGWAGLFTRA
jgi:hypothetical protein